MKHILWILLAGVIVAAGCLTGWATYRARQCGGDDPCWKCPGVCPVLWAGGASAQEVPNAP